MTAPPKPWEVGANRHSMGSIPGIQNVTDSNRLQSSAPLPINSAMQQGAPRTVRRTVQETPAPPPRPHAQRRILRQSYIPNSGYTTPYSSYGSYGTDYGYSGLGYGGFGNYGGYGMNRFGNHLLGNEPESRFVQMAEESSRPAFQSIESLVQAVGSISFMLDSTFHAVYGSFRAVLGVAENFGRLRSVFGQIFSTLSILRLLRWLYRKLQYLLGLQKGREDIWEQAATGSLPPEMETKDAKSSWPIVVFMGIMCAGPYLVWKLANSLSNTIFPNANDPSDWCKCKEPIYSAVALYDFVAESNKELNFKAGQRLLIAPKELQPRNGKGWMLATTNGKTVGLVPYNYLKIIAVINQKTKNIQATTNTQKSQMMPEYDQNIPTLIEQNVSTTTPIMQTAWVPQPVNPQVQTPMVPHPANSRLQTVWDAQPVNEVQAWHNRPVVETELVPEIDTQKTGWVPPQQTDLAPQVAAIPKPEEPLKSDEIKSKENP
ncbi:hypothetical protein C0J52_07904 [Blattella germanica]|nr:hypothetical protein C0J52_07904 [Blattella germanica]